MTIVPQYDSLLSYKSENHRILALLEGFALAYGPGMLQELYGDVREVARYTCEYCMTWRNDMPIYIAREPKLSPQTLEPIWERARHFE